jgi:hypothetical protein
LRLARQIVGGRSKKEVAMNAKGILTGALGLGGQFLTRTLSAREGDSETSRLVLALLAMLRYRRPRCNRMRGRELSLPPGCVLAVRYGSR